MQPSSAACLYEDEFPTCLETYSTLRIFSDDMAPSEITQFLAIEPSKTFMLLPGFPGENSLAGIKVELPEVKQDIVPEPLKTSVTVSFLDQARDLVVDPFDRPVG